MDALLAGAPPESEREARLEGLIRELRAAAPPAPPIVREHVRTLREPEPRKFAWRPVLVALPIAAAVFAGALAVTRGGGSGGTEAAGGGAGADAAARWESTTTPSVSLEAIREAARGTESARRAARASAVPNAAAVAADSTGRAQEWDVTLDLRVGNNDRLSDASADAIRTTRDLGGFVVSSSVGTWQNGGEARLVLRVPSRRIQAAIARLSELGTITAQQVAIQDRQDELDRLRGRIDTLRVQRAELDLRLRTESLTTPERLRLELRRQRVTGLLNRLTATRNGVAREVALAEISLTVRTGKSAAPPSEGRVEGAARDALHVLAVAGAVAVFLLIVVSPLAALAVAAWFARRALRRREHERLLDRPDPVAARE